MKCAVCPYLKNDNTGKHNRPYLHLLWQPLVAVETITAAKEEIRHEAKTTFIQETTVVTMSSVRDKVNYELYLHSNVVTSHALHNWSHALNIITFVTEVMKIMWLFYPKPGCFPNQVVFLPTPNQTVSVQWRSGLLFQVRSKGHSVFGSHWQTSMCWVYNIDL